MNPHISNPYMVWHYTENECTKLNCADYQRMDLKQNKVFINPNFHKNSHINKIHVNPNSGIVCDTVLQNQVVFNTYHNYVQNDTSQSIKIHINPEKRNVLIPQNIHINPKFKPQIELQTKPILPILEKKPAIILTKTKLVRAPSTTTATKHPKRSSVKSKFKIVRNSIYQTPIKSLSDKTRFKVRNGIYQTSMKSQNDETRFKVDHRRTKCLNVDNKHYKIINTKLRRLNETVNGQVLKKVKSPLKTVQTSLSLVKINGVMYKKTDNSLRKMPLCKINTKRPSSIVMRSKYKIVKKCQGKKTEKIRQKFNNVKKFKIVRVQSPLKPKVSVSRKKLKICNIPCPFYRKYGVCRGKENGKCFRKHDPSQIALCTRFLQGACLKEKCLLSHQVSSEKMPTCKYYLEGSCVKENCPYLHVKLSQNSEICRDFLEGFCKEAAECKRRHQYLCPDFEKYGTCPKHRCPYPHGNMVRSFMIHKNKFQNYIQTKNYSKKKKLKDTANVFENKECCEPNEEKRRYYEKYNILESSMILKSNEFEIENIGLQSRPKLGNLPSFIPFNE